MAKAVNLCLAIMLGAVVAWVAILLQTVHANYANQIPSVPSMLMALGIYIIPVALIWRLCANFYHQMFRSKVWLSTLCLAAPVVLVELVFLGQYASFLHAATLIVVTIMAAMIASKAARQLNV